jgi:hypothetical protein
LARRLWLDGVEEVQPLTVVFKLSRTSAVDAVVILAMSLTATVFLLLWDLRPPVVYASILLCVAIVSACLVWRLLDYVFWMGLPMIAAAASRVTARRSPPPSCCRQRPWRSQPIRQTEPSRRAPHADSPTPRPIPASRPVRSMSSARCPGGSFSPNRIWGPTFSPTRRTPRWLPRITGCGGPSSWPTPLSTHRRRSPKARSEAWGWAMSSTARAFRCPFAPEAWVNGFARGFRRRGCSGFPRPERR